MDKSKPSDSVLDCRPYTFIYTFISRPGRNIIIYSDERNSWNRIYYRF